MKETVGLCTQEECTGCMACAGICAKKAINGKFDDEGFIRPDINYDICVECHSCERVCPVLHPLNKYKEGTCYAAWSEDDTIRCKSSSGGLYSEIALTILNSGGLVVGAEMDEEGFVHHTIIESPEKLDKHRGSKYVQSIIDGDLYKKIRSELRTGRQVLFTGTPCQVAAIRKLCNDNTNLYTIDIVCHGVPSSQFFAKIFEDIKRQNPHLVAYNFRKLDSWGVCGSVNINININNVITNHPLTGVHTLYQDAFMKGYMHRPNCYSCKYATTKRIGDITLADFWGIGTLKPIRDEHKKGCSMITINSDKGKALFELIKDRIYFEERDIQETIQSGNEQLVHASVKPVERDTFYKDAFVMDFKTLVRKYDLEIIKKRTLLRRILSKLKRLVIQ